MNKIEVRALIEDLYTSGRLHKEKIPEETYGILFRLVDEDLLKLLKIMPRDAAEFAVDALVSVASQTGDIKIVKDVAEIIKSYRQPILGSILMNIMRIMYSAEKGYPKIIAEYAEIFNSPVAKDFLSAIEREEDPQSLKSTVDLVTNLLRIYPNKDFASLIFKALSNYKERIRCSLILIYHFFFYEIDEKDASEIARALALPEVIKAINMYGIDSYGTNPRFITISFRLAYERGEKFLGLVSQMLTQQKYTSDDATEVLFMLKMIAEDLPPSDDGVKDFERICKIVGRYNGHEAVKVAQFVWRAFSIYRSHPKKFHDVLTALEKDKPIEKVAEKYKIPY
jgi:hypothetical protein